MNTSAKIFLLLSRLSLGWLFFYAGFFSKVLNPNFSAAGFLSGAKTFSGFYAVLISPANIGWVNFLNGWGLTLIGLSLILGIGVRLSSVFGAVLMMLYYFPGLEFPIVGHGYLVDDHIIYAMVLLFFAAIRAGRIYGLEKWFTRMCRCSEGFQKLWG